MKRKGLTIVLMGAMTLLFSFESFAQEKKIKLKDIEIYEVKKPLALYKVERAHLKKSVGPKIETNQIYPTKTKMYRIEKRKYVKAPIPIIDK